MLGFHLSHTVEMKKKSDVNGRCFEKLWIHQMNNK